MLVLFMNRYKKPAARQRMGAVYAVSAQPVSAAVRVAPVCLTEMTLPRTGYVIAAMLVCIAADAFLYLAVRGMAQRSALKGKTTFSPRRSTGRREHYAALTAQYANIRRMRHDIAKHLDTMQALLQSGQYQAAAAYSNEVSAQAQVQAHLGICENPIVDAYLFSRSQELERQGFRVQLRVLLPEATGISDPDLIIAFANLLDNAAEACQTGEDRTILLTAAVSKGLFDHRDRKFLRAAAGKKRRIPELERGIGFSIFQELARKYDGRFSYHAENGRFTASLILKGASLAQHCDL